MSHSCWISSPTPFKLRFMGSPVLSLLFCLPILAAEKPNIVFILADDLGINDLSCEGSTFYGRSLVPALKGELAERSLFWHYPHYGNQGGEPSGIVRHGDFKLIRYYEDGREELYNLRDD